MTKPVNDILNLRLRQYLRFGGQPVTLHHQLAKYRLDLSCQSLHLKISTRPIILIKYTHGEITFLKCIFQKADTRVKFN